jgi:hypothetical protein
MIKFKSLEDCDKVIGKRVSFKHHGKNRSGIVKQYSVENKKVWFDIFDDFTKSISVCNMYKIIELTDDIIENTNPVKVIILK